MNNELVIVGAGIYPFGRSDLTAQQMAVVAIRQALSSAGTTWDKVDFAVGGSLDGGQADVLVKDLGTTGLPFVNVLNGCATGTAALITANSMMAAGEGKLGVVVGMDKHARGALTGNPAEWGVGPWYGESGLFMTPQFFALKLQRYMHDHGITDLTLAQVAEKAFHNGSVTPHAWRRKPLSVEDVLASPMLNDPIRQYMICNPSEGAVALVVARADEADQYTDTPIKLRAASFRSRLHGSFELFQTSLPSTQPITPSELASAAAFRRAGLTPSDVDVWQVQDTEVGAEVMHMAEVGLCEHGEQPELVAAGATRFTGSKPVNTDGGVLANGEPVGASGLRMVYENVVQLRGDAGERQVQGQPQVGFSHVYGAPGISGCVILSR
jgi:acetyl-CoA C-acetyltransferase